MDPRCESRCGFPTVESHPLADAFHRAGSDSGVALYSSVADSAHSSEQLINDNTALVQRIAHHLLARFERNGRDCLDQTASQLWRTMRPGVVIGYHQGLAALPDPTR